ncbi:hypothetical protein ACLBWT_06045 [Paenibacillus sp. D51F]
MRKKTFILGLALTATIGFSSSWAYSEMHPNANVASAESNFTNANEFISSTVSEGEKKVKFKVKKPQKFPFEVNGSYATVTKIADFDKMEITYLGKDPDSYITLTSTEADIIPQSTKFELKRSKIKDKDSQFMDNGKLQFLYWKQDGLSYTLAASPGLDKPHYSQKDLEAIAESLI